MKHERTMPKCIKCYPITPKRSNWCRYICLLRIPLSIQAALSQLSERLHPLSNPELKSFLVECVRNMEAMKEIRARLTVVNSRPTNIEWDAKKLEIDSHWTHFLKRKKKSTFRLVLATSLRKLYSRPAVNEPNDPDREKQFRLFYMLLATADFNTMYVSDTLALAWNLKMRFHPPPLVNCLSTLCSTLHRPWPLSKLRRWFLHRLS